MWMRARVTIVTVAMACAVSPAVAAAGAPATNFDADNHSQNVYYAGTDGSLREIAWVPGSGWGPISTVVPAGSLGAGPGTNHDPENNSQNVYFPGTDGSLREISWTPSARWDHVSVVAPARTLSSAPATNFDPDNHSQNVYFEGADGSLQEKAWAAGAGWGPVSVVAPGGSLGSPPATNFDPDNHSQNVYFEGPDRSLREISWTPSAGWNHVSTVAPAGSLGSGPATNYDADNKSQNVYFEGPDGSLREIAWTRFERVEPHHRDPAGGLARFRAGDELRPGEPQSERVLLGPGRLPAGDLLDSVWPLGRDVGHHPRGHPQRADERAAARPSGWDRVRGAHSGAAQDASELAVKIVISWRWNHRRTRLVRVKLGRLPAPRRAGHQLPRTRMSAAPAVRERRRPCAGGTGRWRARCIARATG